MSIQGVLCGGANRTYNDGYVLVDSSGPLSGSTWNWGNQNVSINRANRRWT